VNLAERSGLSMATNHKIFQHRANCHRKKKMIIKIKDDSGVWIDDHYYPNEVKQQLKQDSNRKLFLEISAHFEHMAVI